MVSRIFVLTLILAALACSRAKASDAMLETRDEFLNGITVEADPQGAVTSAELLQILYGGTSFPRDERILQCLQQVQHCWEGVISKTRERSLCLATARDCRKLVLTTSGAPLPIQIEDMRKPELVQYKMIDLCGEDFQVSQLYAKATDQDLSAALQYMKEKKVDASPYCYILFYDNGQERVVDFHPVRFEPGGFAGSPSAEIPSFSVHLDPISRQVTLGHYVK